MAQTHFDENNIALIGVPSSAGARQVGQERAPRWLRHAGLVEQLRSDGHDVVDLGDLATVTFSPDTENPKRQNLPLVLGVVEQVADAVDAAISGRSRPLVIGGDCSITIGVLAALVRHFPALGLIYFDGDLDLNTPETTVSGIFDGMVLAHILGEGARELSHFGPRYPLLEQQSITLFGYNTEAGAIDAVELERLKKKKMARFPLPEIKGGVKRAAVRALHDLEGRADHFLVHFDVDVVDFNDFPAADVPHEPGLTLVQAQEALTVFLASPRVAGLVVTEFNAARDTDGELARRLKDTLATAMPKRPAVPKSA